MPTDNSDGVVQTIEELTERYQRLNEQKIQAQRDLHNARKRLDELKAKAKQEYDTDDLDELNRLLDEMKRKNEEDRINYQASLDTIESQLGEIEETYDSAGLDQTW